MGRQEVIEIALSAALVASVPASAGRGPDPIPSPAEADRLVAAPLLTASFLAGVTAIAEALEIERERLTMTYLQERTAHLWTLADNGADIDWHEANEYCRELELGGWADWRLPSVDELESLHEKRSNSAHKLPAQFKLTGCCPWSASRSGASSAWNFSFRFRKRFSGSVNYSFDLRALCVRQASTDDLDFFVRAAEEAERERKEKEKEAKAARKRS